MIARLASHWWLFLIRGILALALGVAVPIFPGAAIVTIAILFGAYAFVDGIVAIAAAVRMNHAEGRWPWLLVEGVLGILVGLITFFWPLATIVALAYLAGAWFILTGALAIASAVRMRGHLANEIFLILVGFVSVFAGVVIFFTPIWGLYAVIWTVSVYAILTGIFFIGLAFRLRRLGGGARGAAPLP
ncbi:MAG TPA: HdeD family acid-resistance protein [Candidatus Baltobacteraceae bacterium]|nr:HdeD family acid-resistance protein [Candidatus Baltobacteraceae bacterium]